MSRLSIPNTCFDLQYVRPDFIMLRVIARSLIMWSRFVLVSLGCCNNLLGSVWHPFDPCLLHVCVFRVHPSKDWVWSQIPEIVRCAVEGIGGDDNDIDDMDAEAFTQAYVNIIAGACISLGKMFFSLRTHFMMNLRECLIVDVFQILYMKTLIISLNEII